MSAAVTASPEGFPPQDLRSFLELCEGEWLALRSHFDLALVAEEVAEPATAQDAAGSEGPGAAASDALSDAASEAATDPASDGLPDFAALLQ